MKFKELDIVFVKNEINYSSILDKDWYNKSIKTIPTTKPGVVLHISGNSALVEFSDDIGRYILVTFIPFKDLVIKK